MRIVATSDFHGYLPESIPKCDLLLIAGDVCPVWDHNRQYQAAWLRGDFYDWLLQQPAKHIVWTGGNHDFALQNAGEKFRKQQMFPHYLDNEEIVIDGVKIWASPMSPTFGNWAFMRDDRGLAEVWEMIPRDVDILMVHGPMYGHGDIVPQYVYHPTLGDGEGQGLAPYDSWRKEQIVGERVGSVSLLNRMTYEHFPNLKLFVFGHIHEGYGQELGVHGENRFIAANVSHVDGSYDAVNDPMVFDL